MEIQSNARMQKIEDLDQELVKKEREQVSNKREVADTTSQTEDGFREVRGLDFTDQLRMTFSI